MIKLLPIAIKILFENRRKQLNEETQTITHKEAMELVLGSNGKILTAVFIKKDGTERRMNARIGVKAYLKGGELPYDALPRGYIPLFDLQKKKYRILNTNTMKSLKLNGKDYIIK